ncbi:hypothetical protein HDK77DRAFT_485650 [Phyllosticta capitalensis]|uniref:Uncharacterized protein n=1 Tax=Phyllosticta capitalensis TaxID=121624 RepID=A0ABR1YS17_9PEZI
MAGTPPVTPRRPRPTSLSLDDLVFSPGTKRKRTVFDVDKEIADTPINKESGRTEVVFVKDTNYLDSLKSDEDRTELERAFQASHKAHEVPKKITELRAMIFFVYHRIDGADIKSLVNVPENTFNFLWLHKKHKDAAGKMQCDILAWVKDRVEAIYKRNKNKVQNPIDLAEITSEERVQKFIAFFRKNPVGIAIGMFSPTISSIINFNAIYRTPDHIGGAELAALVRWRTVIYQTFVKTAEAVFQHYFLPILKPEAVTEYKDGDSL